MTLRSHASVLERTPAPSVLTEMKDAAGDEIKQTVDRYNYSELLKAFTVRQLEIERESL